MTTAERSRDRPVARHQASRPSTAAACEACRKLKMRCVRPSDNSQDGSKDLTEPCERCRRNNRSCSIPPPRPLGRKPGAVGRYKGFEKAYRQMQSELKKAHVSSSRSVRDGANSSKDKGEEEILDLLLSNLPGSNDTDDGSSTQSQRQPTSEQRAPGTSSRRQSAAVVNSTSSPETEQVRSPHLPSDPVSSHANREPVSNPLALLADASGAAQALGTAQSESLPDIEPVYGEPSPGASIGRYLLNRPGYVSLGLRLSRDTLENGLGTLFAPLPQIDRYSNYFRSPDFNNPPRDVGPDLDPVELGLMSMEDACGLFPIYFARLHPFNGILDPVLHTPEYVRSQSSLLFTWILALTAQFDHSTGAFAKRLRLHGEKLSCHVHTCGYKSVEIVQGYYISLLSAAPARTLAEERSWLYTMYAFGVAVELGLDQGSRPRRHGTTNIASGIRIRRGSEQNFQDHHDYTPLDDSTYSQRLARNRERTWLRILLWERANSAAAGRMSAFPETELTSNIENWWMHPLADPTDKHTCAFILLRRHLASVHSELRREAHVPHSFPHWVRELINATFDPWRKAWLQDPNAVLPHSERLPNLYLYYVYIHNRLWTLSFALHASINGDRDLDAIREDCFEAAIHCCEVAVRDLQAIGEPLYCMLAPTWAMISYAAVLALKLFPHIHGPRAGHELELLALLSQVALQLERAGTTPLHRFGIAALLGQHLLMILRTRAMGLGVLSVNGSGSQPALSNYCNQSDSHGNLGPPSNGMDMPSESHIYDPLVSTYDPFLTTATMSTEGGLTGEGFADLFREIFGQGFADVF